MCPCYIKFTQTIAPVLLDVAGVGRLHFGALLLAHRALEVRLDVFYRTHSGLNSRIVRASYLTAEAVHVSFSRQALHGFVRMAALSPSWLKV